MRRVVILFLFLSSPLLSLDKKWDFKSDVEQIQINTKKHILNNIENSPSPDDLLPEKDKGKKFDAKDVRDKVLSQNIDSNPVSEFLDENKAETTMLSDIESVLFDPDYSIDSDSGEYVEICMESSEPVKFNIVRFLKYDLQKKTVQEEIFVEKCLGHIKKEKFTRGTGKSEKKKIKKRLDSDPNIEWSKVKCHEGNIGHRDVVTSEWRHVDNCSSCNSKKNYRKFIEKEMENIVNERWEYTNDSLKEIAEDENASFISKKCLDNSTRIINGEEYSKCWVEQFSFLYKPPVIDGCKFLKSQFCRLKSSECLKNGPLGCLVWKRKFLCYKKLNKRTERKIDAKDLGLDDSVWEIEYKPNKNFSDVITKLSVFDEMDKELKSNQEIDVKNFEFFSGKKMRCYVHTLENVAYDCCKKMGGLAVDGKISQCDEDEIALFEMKNRGQCHFIDKKSVKKAGIKTSKKHVYCCFSSKLACVFNEKVRDQLSIGWGDVDHPNCGGLNQKIISRVDFDKIDLSEAYEVPDIDFEDKIERLKTKITDGLKHREDEF